MDQILIAEEAKKFWLEYYPKGYQQLVSEGSLEREAMAAARLTLAEMTAQMLVGASEQEAWEASRALFVFTDPIME